MMKKMSIALVLASIAGFASSAAAQQVAGAFSKGRTHLAVTAGSGSAFDDTYFILGVGVSYYLIDGLNVGLSYENWSGGDPGMYKITPSVQYVFHQPQAVKPYVGAFYRRTSIDGLADLDSYGGRAGVYLSAGRNLYIGAGLVYESYLDCTKSVYRSCDSTYGEATFTVAF
jgi:hypothetical protein